MPSNKIFTRTIWTFSFVRIAKLVPASETATALGFHASCASIATLVASTIAGFVWVNVNPATTFLLTAIVMRMVIVYFIFKKLDETSVG